MNEGRWVYDTTDNRRERCLNGAWSGAPLGDQTAIRHAIQLPALTGTGPTIENVTCLDWGTNGNCINIADNATSTNGRIRNVVARHRHGHEADFDAPTVRTNWVVNITDELGTGWVADGIRGENIENAGLVSNAGAATTGLVSDIVSSGVPPAALCDNANEIGSMFRRTDGGAATTLYICQSAGPWTGK